MSQRFTPMLALVACLSCGDDATAVTPPQFEPLCGEDAPIRLLPLDSLDRIHNGTGMRSVEGEFVADRYLFTVMHDTDTPGEPLTQLWSVGSCGEDPLLLDAAIQRPELVLAYPQYPDVRFVCDAEAQTLVAVDPGGVHDPHATFAAGDCRVLPSEAGLLAVLGGGDTGPLVLQPWPDDPFTETATQTVLHDAVKARPSPSPTRGFIEEVLVVHGEDVFAVTGEHDLVRIDPSSSSATVVMPGVHQFSLGPSGRWLAWQEIGGESQYPQLPPEGPVYVLDRESGESVYIMDAALGLTSTITMRLESLGLVYLRDAGNEFYVTLPDFDVFDVSYTIPLRIIDGHRALLGPPYFIYDADTRDVSPLFTEPHVTARSTEHSLNVLLENGGQLMEVDYDTGERRVLAQHTYRFWHHLADDRVLTLSSLNEATSTGPLTIVEPATFEAAQIDTDVHYSSATPYERDDGLFVSYLVIDDDPERAGIWLANLGK